MECQRKIRINNVVCYIRLVLFSSHTSVSSIAVGTGFRVFPFASVGKPLCQCGSPIIVAIAVHL